MSSLASADLLGDLYQRTCDDARKGRALVQTPPFVRGFILDRTLTPSVDTFGLERTRLVDPACGTGHFLVDAFRRLWALWWARGREALEAQADGVWGQDRPPVEVVIAHTVLSQVVGVDLDPCCVALARYRLVSAAWEATGMPCVAYPVEVYEGDALLHGRPRPGDDERLGPWPYDAGAARRVLAPGQYTAVVANPPYVTCKDARLREAYRERYPTCSGQFSLSVPFMELCFGLAVRGGPVGEVPAA
jgi:SAM-dependent methyltransferase